MYSKLGYFTLDIKILYAETTIVQSKSEEHEKFNYGLYQFGLAGGFIRSSIASWIFIIDNVKDILTSCNLTTPPLTHRLKLKEK